ncbi:ATP10 protein [Colletotrichum higginsianum]|nr:ATP10 protein [Colletotrichum higginsianum]
MAMFMGPSRRAFPCTVCSWRRHLSTSRPFLADKSPAPAPAPDAAPSEPVKPDLPGSAIHAPRAYGKRVKDFTPQPLPRPIGMAHPPHPEDNSGVDRRSLKQRRDDFVDYDKHLVRRKELLVADVSLFFPNFVGETLQKSANNPRDTTRTLLGKLSVVAVYSSQWADDQAKTFISPEANPALHELLAKTQNKTQIVQLNIEDNKFKAWIVKLFMGNLRKQIPEHRWGKYFLVPRGITNEISESIGYLNSKVGYIYLVDSLCRIRWAASGPAHPDERDSLVKGMKLVLHEWNKAEKKVALEAAKTKEAASDEKEK